MSLTSHYSIALIMKKFRKYFIYFFSMAFGNINGNVMKAREHNLF